MSNTLTTVVCSECRKENEPERVYCHNCGTRLDRSAVKVKQEKVEDTQKRVKKMFDPRRAQIRAAFFKISKVVLGAVILAGLIQMGMPPDVPAPSKTALLASQIRFDLEGAAQRRSPAVMQYSDDQLNAFLGYALKTKQASLNKPLLDFNRAAVTIREGKITLTVQRSISGYWPVYTSFSFAPAITGGKVVVQNLGGQIGRLSIHPQVAQHMGIMFDDVRNALDREIKLAAKLGTIEVHDKSLVLTAAPPP